LQKFFGQAAPAVKVQLEAAVAERRNGNTKGSDATLASKEPIGLASFFHLSLSTKGEKKNGT
jgi:hypothetical protein